jgi:hypothetical protein
MPEMGITPFVFALRALLFSTHTENFDPMGDLCEERGDGCGRDFRRESS